MIKQFNHIWRLFGTCLSFSVFGIVGMILGLLILPLTFLFIRNPDKRKKISRSAIAMAFGLFARMMKALGVLDYRIDGLKQLKSNPNRMIIANHPSLIDVVFLLSIFPMVDCVVKKAIIHNPFMLGAVRPADYISNDDTGSFLDDSINRLKAGSNLLLFPEGTRTVPGQPLLFKMGAASIAARSGAEILPVVIKCNQQGYLSKHKPWHWIPDTKPFFDIQILAPLRQNDLVKDAHSQRDATHKLNDALADFYTSKLG